MKIDLFLLAFVMSTGPVHAAAGELNLPADLATVQDGRATIHQLYSSYATLLDKGWILDVIGHSQPAGTERQIPIVALRSSISGPAVWIISGIHGEEAAGPNAIATAIEEIGRLGEHFPVVLIPLSNPHGYVRNWRYLNSPIWSVDVDAQSVGDSSHMLPDPENPEQARAATASSPEADAITRYIVKRMSDYPPIISIDLHEDDRISEGYVYSQGVNGAIEPLATEAVRVLRENGIPIKLEGTTRFDEEIVDGIIGPVIDSSIDELMSAREIIVNGAMRAGPAARTVLVFETPAGDLPLALRTKAHDALLRRMILLISASEI
jgi:hypothetical protein